MAAARSSGSRTRRRSQTHRRRHPRTELVGQEQTISADEQISLDDEVAIEVAALLRDGGIRLQLEPGSDGDEQLALQLPAPRFLRLRESIRDGSQRLVIDLSGPTLLPRSDGQLELPLSNPSAAARALRQRGLEAGIDGWRVLLPIEAGANSSLASPPGWCSMSAATGWRRWPNGRNRCCPLAVAACRWSSDVWESAARTTRSALCV